MVAAHPNSAGISTLVFINLIAVQVLPTILFCLTRYVTHVLNVEITVYNINRSS